MPTAVVIAIDGGAASGKGTLSKKIATIFTLAHLVGQRRGFRIATHWLPQSDTTAL